MASPDSALRGQEGADAWTGLLAGFLRDRLQVNALLIVLCFVSILALDSTAAARVPTYLLALSMLVAARGWTDVFGRKLTWLIMALVTLLAASSLWSRTVTPASVTAAFAQALLVFLFVVAFAECQLRGQLRRWVGRAMALVGLSAVVAAIVVFYVTDPPDGRLSGLGQLDDHVTAALVFGVVFILMLDVAYTDSSGVWRALAVVSAVVLVWAIYLSDSRNAWVSSLIGVGIFLLARRVKDPQRFVAGVVSMGFVLGVLLAALIANEATREIILPRGTSFRPEIWGDVVADLTRRGLWFGRGIDTPYEVIAGGIEFLHPHSMFLSVAYQGGVVALVLFLGLIGAMLTVLIRSYHEPDAKLALGVLGVSLPAYLLDGHELIGQVAATWFLFWLPVAVGLGFSWRWLPRGL